ncbi:dTDP-4-amino-4,6-dideoxygalactose transaminase [Enterovibrio makurazakiensis]|uniref:dTDP-4-amino-4,6-dideoxygalactose transaminase n=1 Tax=Enterovibrio makurazakiensis TaxID=2910232 RepID=UPI003D22CD90
MIPFTKPTVVGSEEAYLSEAIRVGQLSGDGIFTQRCHDWFEAKLRCRKALLTPSCTSALEMAALLVDLEPGDEVIMPSYTFVSTANAFVLRGAKIVFVDIRPDTMNLDENKIEAAITSRTKVIVPVHYAGVSCEMGTIMEIAARHNLWVVEDAAQGMMSEYNGKYLGTLGHIGTYSFHATKNYTSGGEGGLLIINDPTLAERAEIIREKGTNRSNFLRGKIDKYTWVDIGSSFLPSELQAAYLYAQLECSEKIHTDRLNLWNVYYKELSHITSIDLAVIPGKCKHNGHIFYIKLKDAIERKRLINYLVDFGVFSTSHYVPLHSSPWYLANEGVIPKLNVTDSESSRILRLPIFSGMDVTQVLYVSGLIKEYFGNAE